MMVFRVDNLKILGEDMGSFMFYLDWFSDFPSVIHSIWMNKHPDSYRSFNRVFTYDVMVKVGHADPEYKKKNPKSHFSQIILC